MKKLFFRAIALVAFSGVSMANTKADEKTNESVIKKQTTGTVSCTRRVTTTCEDGSTVTIVSTQSVPSTGDTTIDMGRACEKALAKAKSLSLSAC